jgi:hypothetical protein
MNPSITEGPLGPNNELPDPLGGIPWHVGSWALPSTTLSIASAVVLALVAIYLQRSPELRALFLLPAPWGLVTAAAAAILAGCVAWKGRARPGPLVPRLWALFLVVSSSVLAVALLAQGGSPGRPRLHAVAVGALGAALTLLPRLGRLRPTSRWLLSLAPVSLVITLLLAVPAANAVESRVLAGQRDRVAARIGELHQWAEVVRTVAGHDWPRLADHVTASAQEVEKLQALRPGDVAHDRDLWRVAAVLGQEAKLAQGLVDLQSAVVAAFNPVHTPKVSSFKEPSLYWDHPQEAPGTWRESGSFAGLSGIVGSYHREVGRLLAEITVIQPAESPTLAALAGRLEAGRAQAAAYLRTVLGTWSDAWVVFEVPGHDALVVGDRQPLAEVLRSPLLAIQARSLTAGDLYRLSRLPLGAAADLPRRSPGCHARSYREGERQYFRVDCYSYAPRSVDAGAELSVELRLVYQSAPPGALADGDLPEEVFYLFFLPPAAGGEPFRQEVMAALAQEATRRGEVSLFNESRAGTTATGFQLVAGDNSRTVALRPQLQRLVKGKDAIEVQVRWEPPPLILLDAAPLKRSSLVLRGRR